MLINTVRKSWVGYNGSIQWTADSSRNMKLEKLCKFIVIPNKNTNINELIWG